MSKVKTNETGATLSLKAATIISGAELFRPTSDVAFDIETGPAKPGMEDAALLDAATARIAAIGYYQPSQDRYLLAYDKDEAAVLRQFWDVFLSVNSVGAKLVGFNIFGFDLPFIMRRSWFHGIAVPRNTMTLGGRYFADTFVDLMAQWKCGSYREFISLDALARFLGVGEKTGTGEQFYRLWDKDRQAAIDYLVNDVRITHGCAQKMNMLSASA